MSVTRADNTTAVMNAIARGVENGLDDIGFEVGMNAVDRVHVVTGRLRDSIDYTVEGESVYVFADTEYAAYEELGTSRQPAHPYLKPAATENTQKILSLMESAIAKEIS